MRTRFEGFGKEMQREISLIQDATQHRWNLPEFRIRSQLEPPGSIPIRGDMIVDMDGCGMFKARFYPKDIAKKDFSW